MKNLTTPNFDKLVGASQIKSTGKWRTYINGQHIGVFDSKLEAILARLTIEEIFTNILSKFEIDTFFFRRNKTITMEILLEEVPFTIVIPTGVEYTNSRKKSTGESNG